MSNRAIPRLLPPCGPTAPVNWIRALVVVVLLSAGCTTGSNAVSGAPQQSSHSRTAVVTFAVGDERFSVLLISSDLIANARGLLAGEALKSIPVGLLVRGGDGGVNKGHDWYLDPASLQFADVTTEVCDGRPSDVDDASNWSADEYCPWSARVTAVEPGS